MDIGCCRQSVKRWVHDVSQASLKGLSLMSLSEIPAYSWDTSYSYRCASFWGMFWGPLAIKCLTICIFTFKLLFLGYFSHFSLKKNKHKNIQAKKKQHLLGLFFIIITKTFTFMLRSVSAGSNAWILHVFICCILVMLGSYWRDSGSPAPISFEISYLWISDRSWSTEQCSAYLCFQSLNLSIFV